jgi:outer membrane protein assembly factor BamB
MRSRSLRMRGACLSSGMRFVGVLLALSAATLVAAGAPVRAATTSLRLSPTAGPPTIQVKANGAGFHAGERVAVRFDGTTLKTVSAGPLGGFATAFSVPASARPGPHTVRATGISSSDTAAATFTVRTNWPQFRDGPKHLGFNRYENVITRSNVAKLHMVWSSPTGISPYSPAVAERAVYTESYGRLNSLDSSTGAARWSVSVPQGASAAVACAYYSWAIASSPAVDAGRVFVGSTDGRVRAYGTGHGALLWASPTGSPIYASPTVAGGVVYVGSNDGYLYAFNAATGARMWRALTTPMGVNSSASVDGGTVFVGGCDGRIYALSASTGALRWSQTVSEYSIGSSAAVADGVVYVDSDTGLVALDAATGKVLWQQWVGEVQVSSPAVANGVVYVGTGGYAGGGNDYGGVVAFDAKTGAEKWSNLFGWTYVTASPAVAAGVVYVTCEDGHLVALNASTGAVLRRIPIHVQADSSPAVSDGRVIVSDFTTWTSGITYAFAP